MSPEPAEVKKKRGKKDTAAVVLRNAVEKPEPDEKGDMATKKANRQAAIGFLGRLLNLHTASNKVFDPENDYHAEGISELFELAETTEEELEDRGLDEKILGEIKALVRRFKEIGF